MILGICRDADFIAILLVYKYIYASIIYYVANTIYGKNDCILDSYIVRLSAYDIKKCMEIR